MQAMEGGTGFCPRERGHGEIDMVVSLRADLRCEAMEKERGFIQGRGDSLVEVTQEAYKTLRGY